MSLINREALMKELGIGMDCSVCEHNETPYCIWKPNVVDICEAITDAPTIEPDWDAIWDSLSKVYNMKDVPDEAKSIIGDLMLSLDGGRR